MSLPLHSTYIDASDSGTVVYQDELIIDANRQFLHLTDFDLDELLGKNVHELFSTDSHSITKHIMSVKECAPIEIYCLRKDGTSYLSEVRHVSTDHSDKKGIFYLKDISHKLYGSQLTGISSEEIMAILNGIQDTCYRTNRQGEIIWLSPSVYSLLGYSPSEVIGQKLSDHYWDDDGRDKFIKQLNAAGGSLEQYEAAMRHKDNSLVWVSTNAHYYYDADGNPLGIEGTTRDITQLRLAQEALHTEKEQAEVTLAAVIDGVVRTNNCQIIEYINPAAEKICGHSLDEVVGRSLNEIFCLSLEDSNESFSCSLETCCTKLAKQNIPQQLLLTRSDGSTITLEHSANPVLDSKGKQSGIVVVFRDVTDLNSMTKSMAYQASHDSLTGLINRYEFENRLNYLLASSSCEHGQHVLCYLDLDQFKIVNDTCGHIAGDKLLCQLTGRFQMSIREHDILARLGGDEFGVLLENMSVDDAITIIERIRKITEEYRFKWDDKIFQVGVSIGIVAITANDSNFTDILSAADSACYIAKDMGGNRIHIYQANDEAIAHRKGEMHWVQQLKHAHKEERFVLHQQIARSLDANQNAIEYVEFLLRIIDDQGELVTPAVYIKAAERFKLILDIDKWVVRKVLSLLSSYDGNDQRIYAVNISAQSVCDTSFHDYVISQLENADPSLAKILCFEITETSAITNLAKANLFIKRLKSMGCKFALDDFGSGLSSFGYLKNIPVDYLKIDGSFIRSLIDNPIDQAMIRAINEVGHLMDKITIAECVENQQQLEILEKIGIDYVQGFYIDKPSEK